MTRAPLYRRSEPGPAPRVAPALPELAGTRESRHRRNASRCTREAAPRQAIGGRAGLTLVELLVGVAMTAALLAALSSFFAGTLGAWRRSASVIATNDELLAALEQIGRDVRTAGFDPQRRGHDAIVAASPRRLALAADLDGDGRIDRRSRERIAYRRSGAGRLLRVVGRQAMPLATDLAPDGLRFAFRDEHDALVDPRRAREQIRTVSVVLETRDRRVVGGARLLNR